MSATLIPAAGPELPPMGLPAEMSVEDLKDVMRRQAAVDNMTGRELLDHFGFALVTGDPSRQAARALLGNIGLISF